jgi:hypothetical protein
MASIFQNSTLPVCKNIMDVSGKSLCSQCGFMWIHKVTISQGFEETKKGGNGQS